MIRVFMIRGFLLLALASISLTKALPPEPPALIYHNRASVTDPQVNALHFINDGFIDIFGLFPWDPQNTITYTNRGVMFGANGLRFENVDVPFGIRRPSEVFFNAPTGDIDATDLLKVNANSITNRGVLSVGPIGFIQLHGRSVDLTAGALIVGDPTSGGGGFGGFPNQDDTNFFPAVGILDSAWGISTYTNTRIGGIITTVDPTTVSTPTPAPLLTNFFGGTQSGAIQLDEAMLWTREEVIDETNEVVQVIAVQLSDPSISAVASFVPITFYDSEPLGDFLTAAVELRVGNTDFRTLVRITNSVYVLDQLGASTNRALMENNRDGTFRPGNFIVHRGPTDMYAGQPPSTGVRDDILLARQNGPYETMPYVNTDVFTNDWAGYEGEIDNVSFQIPDVPGGSLTNLGGQVEVDAGQLIIRNTRVRGEGFVFLSGTNVVIAGENLIDTPRLSLSFGSGPGELRLNEFIPDSVERFSGGFSAYGTVFTNYYERVMTNAPTEPDGAETLATNQVQVRFQVTIVDARGLQTREPVTVYDLRLTSTNGPASIFFNENLVLASSLLLDTRELTFSEGSSLSTPDGFSYTNVLNVRVLTNLGSLFIGDFGDFQTSETVPYETFHNGGTIFANGIEIWANEFVNTNNGAIISQGLLDIDADSISIGSGFFQANLDIRLSAANATIANWQADAGARLVLDVSQTLTDRGPEEPNTITTMGGVQMFPTRPAGDLLGTVFINRAAPLDFVDFIWSADDRGASAGAFENNLALGGLVLDGGNLAVFQFLPAREGAALYVDVLEIGGTHAESLSALTNRLVLGMNIYYSEVISTNFYITAQALDRVFGPDAPYNLIWVPEFEGPGSVEVALGQNGLTKRMSQLMRQSMVVDSDGDGIPNALDPYPLTAAVPGENTGVQLGNVQRNAEGGISFNLSGNVATKFVIEYTTNLVSPDWTAITGPLTASDLGALQTFTDDNAGSAQGYYRLKLVP